MRSGAYFNVFSLSFCWRFSAQGQPISKSVILLLTLSTILASTLLASTLSSQHKLEHPRKPSHDCFHTSVWAVWENNKEDQTRLAYGFLKAQSTGSCVLRCVYFPGPSHTICISRHSRCFFSFPCIIAGLPLARSALWTEPHTHKIWLTFFRLVVTWFTERTCASTDCKGRVGETIKREGGVSQACLGKSTSCILDIHKMVNWQLSK